MKMRRTVMIVILAVSFFLIVFGIFKGDINLVESFGRFICLDCIGIS